MFSKRFLVGLGGVALVLGGLWLVYMYRQVPHRQKPFANAMSKAGEIVIREPSGVLQLKKVAGSWKVVGFSDQVYPADNNKVGNLTSALISAALEDVISDNPASYPDFETTKDSGTHVSVNDSNGRILASGLFGKQSPDFTHLYFRYPDRPEVYLLRGVIRGEIGPVNVKAWRDADLLSVPETDVRFLQIQNPSGTLSLEHSSETWTSGGRVIDPAPIYTLLGVLGHLKADDWVEPSTASIRMEALTFASVTLKTDKATSSLKIGPLDKKSNRYPVAASAEAGVAWVAADRLKPVFLKASDLKTK